MADEQDGKITSKAEVTDLGQRLLKLFREQQQKHGNIGCTCLGCQGDMVKAVEKLIAEGVVIIVKNA